MRRRARFLWSPNTSTTAFRPSRPAARNPLHLIRFPGFVQSNLYRRSTSYYDAGVASREEQPTGAVLWITRRVLRYWSGGGLAERGDAVSPRRHYSGEEV